MKRPNLTPEIVAQAVQKLAAGNGWDAEKVIEIAKTFRSHMDGYQLAKELERRFYWDIEAKARAEVKIAADKERAEEAALAARVKAEREAEPKEIRQVTAVVADARKEINDNLIAANVSTDESMKKANKFADEMVEWGNWVSDGRGNRAQKDEVGLDTKSRNGLDPDYIIWPLRSRQERCTCMAARIIQRKGGVR